MTKITSIKIKKYNAKLARPFSYFTATLNYLPYVLVVIESSSRTKGYGEAGVAWDVTGETQGSAFGVLEHIKPLIVNKNIDELQDVEAIMSKMNEFIYNNTAFKSAIEMALLDLLGKEKNLPVWQIMGGKNPGYITPQKVFSFGDEQSEQLETKVNNALEAGYKILKLKVGANFDRDFTLIKNIVALRPDINLVLDVNQGWRDSKTAKNNIKKLHLFKTNIKWIEQPIACLDYDGLAEIKKVSEIPIMVDESCHTLYDLKIIHRYKAADIVNLKLAKTGGMIEMKKMIEFCEKNNIQYMLGDMIYSALGTAANLHTATLGNFISYDITPADYIIDDCFTGISFDKAKVYIPTEKGLGVGLKR